MHVILLVENERSSKKCSCGKMGKKKFNCGQRKVGLIALKKNCTSDFSTMWPYFKSTEEMTNQIYQVSSAQFYHCPSIHWPLGCVSNAIPSGWFRPAKFGPCTGYGSSLFIPASIHDIIVHLLTFTQLGIIIEA